jgi:lipopolysaccharide/colanic/teichoic acid biosynthesis glycosyltransferase
MKLVEQPTIQLRLKRLVDIIVSATGLVLLSPLFAVVAALIRWDSQGPVFYRGTRVGLNGKVFTMYKFRSMVPDAEFRLASLQHINLAGVHMVKIPNDPRVTHLGAYLRASSVDELPQLWNVLKGDMSLVGPRPQNPAEVALYTPTQRVRLAVRPGITGLWQVTARDDPNFDTCIALDLEYVHNWSLWRDLDLLARTPRAVFRPACPSPNETNDATALADDSASFAVRVDELEQ